MSGDRDGLHGLEFSLQRVDEGSGQRGEVPTRLLVPPERCGAHTRRSQRFGRDRSARISIKCVQDLLAVIPKLPQRQCARQRVPRGSAQRL